MARMFDSRLDAARRLATALEKYRGKNPLVLAIPRGASCERDDPNACWRRCGRPGAAGEATAPW